MECREKLRKGDRETNADRKMERGRDTHTETDRKHVML